MKRRRKGCYDKDKKEKKEIFLEKSTQKDRRTESKEIKRKKKNENIANKELKERTQLKQKAKKYAFISMDRNIKKKKSRTVKNHERMERMERMTKKGSTEIRERKLDVKIYIIYINGHQRRRDKSKK